MSQSQADYDNEKFHYEEGQEERELQEAAESFASFHQGGHIWGVATSVGGKRKIVAFCDLGVKPNVPESWEGFEVEVLHSSRPVAFSPAE